MKKISIVAISLVLIFAIGISSISCAQNTKATLEGGALLYTLANNSSSYRFIVMYKDADGDLPKYMFVYINSSRRPMVKQDITDNNPKDGILYVLSLTQDELSQFTRGTSEHNVKYYFRTNDGHGIVSTEESSSMTLDYEQMGLVMEYSSGSGGTCGR
ncbi:MAG: hypothetical protein AMQ22_01710 [Candidatus Methanofastidiosum methylothiophilum]|uniref:Uncharacterized protein n=1 Tax=Candidatus Methanofastidiosum methylothiophilum TaxID=1705564 RepID=A0A150IVW3_9EURY|nr:MAG: hypothetical protein AMQ22_01710 [Candidatus Methanofastidiosum methylthiophilus]